MKGANGPISSNEFIEKELTERLVAVASATGGDAVTFIGPIGDGVDMFLRDIVEEIDHRQDKVSVVLETNGGSIEVAERIADMLRHNYTVVDFIVPNFAMSAGTIIVLSGDDILMDYFSILGPIDPQIQNNEGLYIPTLGYLAKYDELMKKANRGSLNSAEMTYLVERFDPAELHQFENARDLSITLLKKWLVKYKFKNWHLTDTSKKPVTENMKKTRAASIASKLNKTSEWGSHGRGLSREVLLNDVGVKTTDFGADPKLNDPIRDYYKLLRDYMGRRGHQIAGHSVKAYIGL